MISDYPNLSYSAIEKCSRKDLNGKIKVYTKKCVDFSEFDHEIETRDIGTQTRSIPSYMNPPNRNLFA